ncbi:unnamed protein product [Nippostrongylus brasiliensis]|uniref:Uncharacterized protein n=1 Tax=Nippostrongylus brasiliensis TaxID=27835 RepID=A0A0N4XIN1_NIPBR|nr:unnamed protein product [Nippostrongylus brasiliensis]
MCGASNRRKPAASPAPKPRRFGDKIALHHCNDEKKLARKRMTKALEGKAKFLGRKRKVSSPSQKENQFSVGFVTKNTLNTLQSGADQKLENSLLLCDKELQPRLSDERVDTEAYIKRHEKCEKEEKQILRRDRIWQNEIRRRSRLLRIEQAPPRHRDFRIVLLRKLSRSVK